MNLPQMPDFNELAKEMEPIIRAAGAYVRSAVPRQTQEKSNHSDLVTEYDVNTQRMLTEALGNLHPHAVFVGEEEHLQGDVTKGDCFVIDPIDGTTNFVKGFHRSAISVALLRDGTPGIGIVYNPWANEYFCAVAGQGAFCNGQPLHIGPTTLEDCVVGCGTSPYYPELAQRTCRILSKVLSVALDIRRMGSAALDLCDAALGRTGAFFELQLSPWDFAAAGLILTEAGGIITDDLGRPVSLEHPSPIVAGHPVACAHLRTILQQTP